MRSHFVLLVTAAIVAGCVNGAPEDSERGANAVSDAELMGVAINVRWDSQRPSVDDLQRLGARWVRTLVYDGNHDQAAETLASYHCLGVRSLVLLNQESFGSTGSIPTSNDDSEWETYAAVFADNAAAFVSAHASSIDAVEVWNEPDLPTGGNIPPERFGLLLYKTYPKLKAILGSKPVVQGAVAGSEWPDYLRRAAQWMNVRGNYSDGVGVHPYGQRAAGYPSGWGFGELEDVVRTTYERGNESRSGGWKPVWISEFGMPSEAGDAPTYLSRAYGVLDRLHGEGIVQHAFWFAWDDTTHYDPEHEHFGLVEPSGGNPRPLRASGQTFAKLAGSLAACGATPPPDPPPSSTPVGGDAISACYDRNGGAAGNGSPADNGGGAAVHRWGAGEVQDYAGGSNGPSMCMHADGTSDAWMVRGAIRDVYLANGGGEGFLGYPIEDEHTDGGVPLQRFQHGYITHDGTEFKAFSGESAPPPPPPPASGCPCMDGKNNYCLYGTSVDGCPMTSPGGYCDPNGDGDFADADWVRGYDEHHAACGD
ncbi:MAG: glycosyl hydrolase [Polyangiales bacterium]